MPVGHASCFNDFDMDLGCCGGVEMKHDKYMMQIMFFPGLCPDILCLRGWYTLLETNIAPKIVGFQ